MLKVLETQRDSIIRACRRYGVKRMHVFGSALRDDFRPGESDIDRLVEFAPRHPHQLVDAYFDLLDELRSILGAPVDLVMAEDIDRTKQVLYAA